MQTRAHIIRDGTEIFSDNSRGAARVQNRLQIMFARAAIGLGLRRTIISARREMRGTPTGFLQHLFPVQGQDFLVQLWPPRKGVDAVKAEHVIDAEEMKNVADPAGATLPPGETVLLHYIPAISRDAPV